LAFNWQIIKSPHSITDYVVIHELCHLIHPNHSKAFWQLVARHDPAYGQHRQWLRERGASLL
jgi:predicted metal-dependent hydrolase